MRGALALFALAGVLVGSKAVGEETIRDQPYAEELGAWFLIDGTRMPQPSHWVLASNVSKTKFVGPHALVGTGSILVECEWGELSLEVYFMVPVEHARGDTARLRFRLDDGAFFTETWPVMDISEDGKKASIVKTPNPELWLERLGGAETLSLSYTAAGAVETSGIFDLSGLNDARRFLANVGCD